MFKSEHKYISMFGGLGHDFIPIIERPHEESKSLICVQRPPQPKQRDSYADPDLSGEDMLDDAYDSELESDLDDDWSLFPLE